VNRPATLTLRVRPTLAAAGVLSVGLLGACSSLSSTQTSVPYQPADGVAATIGAVQARNLLVVAAQKDAPGVVSGSVVNTGTEAVTLNVMTREEAEAGTSKGIPVQLKAGEQKRLESVQLAKVPEPPGDLTFLVLETAAGQTLVNVPVLPPILYYSTLTPTPGAGLATSPATSPATSSATSAGTASGSPATSTSTSG
jgi:hypothetical protein